MSHIVLVAASVTLGVGYAVAGLMRIYAGWLRPVLRFWYWVSAIGCFGLSANQWWFLGTGAPYSNRAMNALVWAIVVMVSALTQPVLIAIRQRDMGARPGR